MQDSNLKDGKHENEVSVSFRRTVGLKQFVVVHRHDGKCSTHYRNINPKNGEVWQSSKDDKKHSDKKHGKNQSISYQGLQKEANGRERMTEPIPQKKPDGRGKASKKGKGVGGHNRKPPTSVISVRLPDSLIETYGIDRLWVVNAINLKIEKEGLK